MVTELIMSLNFKIALLLLLFFSGVLVAEEGLFSAGREDIDSSKANASVLLNAFKSLLIPGWGELSVGSPGGYAFLGADIMLWASRFYCGEEVKLHEKDALNYAFQYAGVNAGKHSDDYLYLLGRYNSSGFEPGGYNETIVKRANNLYPNDSAARNQYINDNAIFDDNLYWEWESREARRQYSIKRKNADHNRDYIKAITGIIVANRIISVFNAVRATRKSNRIEVELNFEPNEKTTMMNIEYKF